MAEPPQLYDLLLFGGKADPSIEALLNACRRGGIKCLSVRHDAKTEPAIEWCLAENSLVIDGVAVAARSAFLRYDVFSSKPSGREDIDRAFGWFTTVQSACLASPELKLANAAMDARVSHKGFVLSVAHQHGLAIPATTMTNIQRSIVDACKVKPHIAKPAGGGGYCAKAEDAVHSTEWCEGRAPTPAIIQPMLTYPEYRLFRFGDTFMAFEIHSDHLDYRPHSNTRMSPIPVEKMGEDLLTKMTTMSDFFGVDFFACDFKTCPETGAIIFLEMNTGPMFAAHDAVSDGALTTTLLNWLIG